MSAASNLFDEQDLSHDNSRNSSLIIREDSDALTLYFNESDVQSAMNKHAPDKLMVSYTRTMMRCLSLKTRPRHIGMIGLGGGSILKYCYHRLPDTTISVAEINPEVIALRDRFLLPKDDHRLTVFREDGADFVRRRTGQFDILLVDGFDEKGQPPRLCSRQFYNHCYKSLKTSGLLVVNVFDGRLLISRIRRTFRNQVIIADGGVDSLNTIVFAGKDNVLGSLQCLPNIDQVEQ